MLKVISGEGTIEEIVSEMQKFIQREIIISTLELL
jgi:hypothetical protein